MNAQQSLGAVLLLATLVNAQQVEIDAHVRSLRSDDWQTRQKAEDALVATGEKAVDAITDALKDETLDTEVRERLQSALSRINEQSVLAPTRVTVVEEFRSPNEAFQKLASFVGLTVEAQNGQANVRAQSDSPVAVAWKNVPWLEAMNELSARTGIATEIGHGDRLLLLDESTRALRPPMSIMGSAAVVASRVRQVETRNLGGGPTRAILHLDLLVTLEPKADLIESSAQLILHRVTDASGNVLYANQELGLSRRSARTFLSVFPLGEPRKELTKIGSIEGELLGEMVSRFEQHRIDSLATLPKTFEFAGGTIEVAAIQSDPTGHTLTLKLSHSIVGRPAGLLVTENEVEGLRVLDGDGKPMPLTRVSEESIGDRIEFRYRIAAGPTATARPSSMVWTLPAETREFHLPFKLANLRLP